VAAAPDDFNTNDPVGFTAEEAIQIRKLISRTGATAREVALVTLATRGLGARRPHQAERSALSPG